MKNIIHDLNKLSADILKFANAFEETGNRHVYKRLVDFHTRVDQLYNQLANLDKGKVGRAGYVARLLSAAVVAQPFLRACGVEKEVFTGIGNKIGQVLFFELKTLKQSDALDEGMIKKFWDDAIQLRPGTFHSVEAVWNESVNPPDKIRHSKWDNAVIRIQTYNSVEVIQLWIVAEEPKENQGPLLV